MVATKGTAYSKYEAVYTLAKLGFKQSDIVDLTLNDVKITKGTMIVKDTKLNLEEAKVIAVYLSDQGHNIVSWLFFGANGNEQLKPKSFRGLFMRYLRKNYGVTMDDIGWTAPRSVPPKPVIESMDDILRILDGVKKSHTV